MSKKSMVAINPQISLTIGNPEIVNMLVQQQVRALKKELKDLKEENGKRLQILQAGVVEIIASLNADFKNAFGKKLDTYTKARSKLLGKKVTWTNPFPEHPSNDDIYSYGGVCILSYRGRLYGRDRGWTEADEKALPQAVSTAVNFGEIPTVKELDEWYDSWREEFETREEANEAWSADNGESSEFALEFKRSEKTIELIKKYRAIDNEGIPLNNRVAELEGLLADTANIEKAILAQMTQNTLENNPELVEAFGVLANGILGFEPLGAKQLVVEAE